jgi:predicted nucleic acid-binding protein
MERVTLDTNVLLELWKNQDRRAITEELLRRA